MTRRSFAVVASRLKEELENIERLLKELSDKGLKGSTDRLKLAFTEEDKFTLRAVGSILHDFYVAVENIFKIIAKEIDEKPPKGDHWHRELLLQMTLSIPEIRPSLLTKNTAATLDEFRAFRHVFRNVYGFNLSAVKIEDLVEQMPAAAECLEKEVNLFIKKMYEILPE